MYNVARKPRLYLRCAYGMHTAAYRDDNGVARLDISQAELDRYQKELKKLLKRDATVIELWEHVKEAITQ